jgi:regulator of protease activity HflC (stomatin/prohibitin superfamily)
LLYSIIYLRLFLDAADTLNKKVAGLIPMTLIPFIIIWLGLLMIAGTANMFFREFYKAPPEISAGRLIRRRLFGVVPLPPPLNNIWKYPFIVLETPVLKEKDMWAHWFGGPAILVIYDGAALYLERGNRFSRVVGPGVPVPFLERFERIRAVVDLRPQTISMQVSNYSKDGIEVCVELRLICQINFSQQALARSRNLVYPFDPVEVRKAVERMTVRKRDDVLIEADWLEGIKGRVTGRFSAYITSHRLDELFVELDKITGRHAAAENTQLLSSPAVRHIMDELNEGFAADGCRIHSLQVLSIKVPDKVADERLSYWISEREKLIRIREGKSEAEQIRIKKLAEANAQRDLFEAIAKSLENVNASDYIDTLLLSFSSVLNQYLNDPYARAYFAVESPDLIKKLEKILSSDSKSPGEEK